MFLYSLMSSLPKYTLTVIIVNITLTAISPSIKLTNSYLSLFALSFSQTSFTSLHFCQFCFLIEHWRVFLYTMASSARTSEIFLVCCLEANNNIISRILKKNRKSWIGGTNFDINCRDASGRTGLILATLGWDSWK